jgi:hypothetical protein
VALTAPVRDANAARSSLEAWLREVGPVHAVRSSAGRTALASGDGRRARMGMVAPVRGALRLLTASGAQAAAALAAIGQIGAKTGATSTLSGDAAMRPGLVRLTGPAALVVGTRDPLRGAALALDGSPQGLVANGLVLARAPLLAGKAPGATACAGATLLCIRARLERGGRELLAAAARSYLSALFEDAKNREAADRFVQRAARSAEQLVVRSDGADVRFLSGRRSPFWALRVGAVSAPGPGEASVDAQSPRPSCIRSTEAVAWFATPCTQNVPADPRAPDGDAALDAQLDLGAADRALQDLTPLDALQGGTAGALFAARLSISGLLRHSGPLSVRGNPHPLGAEVELRWPLH